MGLARFGPHGSHGTRRAGGGRWCLVGDERRKVVSRAGAPLPVSSRSGHDVIKVGDGVARLAMKRAACIDTEGPELVVPR